MVSFFYALAIKLKPWSVIFSTHQSNFQHKTLEKVSIPAHPSPENHGIYYLYT